MTAGISYKPDKAYTAKYAPKIMNLKLIFEINVYIIPVRLRE